MSIVELPQLLALLLLVPSGAPLTPGAGGSVVDAIATDTILEGDISSGGGGGHGVHAVGTGSAAAGTTVPVTAASYSHTAAAPSVAAAAAVVWCYSCANLNLTDTSCEDPPDTGALHSVPCPSGRCFKSTVTYHVRNIGGGAFYGRGCVAATEAEAAAEEPVCGVKSETHVHGTTESTECFCLGHLCNAAPPPATKMETTKMVLRLILSTVGSRLLAAATAVI